MHEYPLGQGVDVERNVLVVVAFKDEVSPFEIGVGPVRVSVGQESVLGCLFAAEEDGMVPGGFPERLYLRDAFLGPSGQAESHQQYTTDKG